MRSERGTGIVYPANDSVFNAFKLTPLDKVRVLCLGQDPYVQAGQAHGLAFSVPTGVKPPPSLLNIFKEQRTDLGIEQPSDMGNLEGWARQGVLLLNSVLTVRAGESGSHKQAGWMEFTDGAISLVNQQDRPVVYLLLGSFAKSKRALITNSKHCVITAAHPSPLSAHAGFFGSKVFSRTNAFLEEQDIEPIDWQL